MSFPPYSWNCTACEHVNVYGRPLCAACGLPNAPADARVSAARLARGLGPVPVPEMPKEPAPAPVTSNAVFGCFFFGIFCIVAAWDSIAHGRWPFFTPPQLDVFASLGPTGGGLVLGLLGAFSIVLGVALMSWHSGKG